MVNELFPTQISFEMTITKPQNKADGPDMSE